MPWVKVYDATNDSEFVEWRQGDRMPVATAAIAEVDPRHVDLPWRRCSKEMPKPLVLCLVLGRHSPPDGTKGGRFYEMKIARIEAGHGGAAWRDVEGNWISTDVEWWCPVGSPQDIGRRLAKV